MAEREGTETKSLLWELDLDFLELHRNLLTIIVSSVFPLVPTGRARYILTRQERGALSCHHERLGCSAYFGVGEESLAE